MENERDCEKDWSNTDDDILVNLALTELKSSVDKMVEVERMLKAVDSKNIDVSGLEDRTNYAQEFLETLAEKMEIDIMSWRSN